jgi:hypothetical protein
VCREAPTGCVFTRKKWEKGKMREMGWGRKKIEKTIMEWDRGSRDMERGEGKCVVAWVAMHSGG